MTIPPGAMLQARFCFAHVVIPKSLYSFWAACGSAAKIPPMNRFTTAKNRFTHFTSGQKC
jgi:hypothetical protein